MLDKIEDNISFKLFMDLWNDLLLGSSELFPKEAVEKAVEKSNRVFHDGQFGRPYHRTSQPRSLLRDCSFHIRCCKLGLPNVPFPSPPGSRQGSVLHLPHPLVLRLLPPAGAGEGRSFKSFSPSSQLQMGGVLGWHRAS